MLFTYFFVLLVVRAFKAEWKEQRSNRALHRICALQLANRLRDFAFLKLAPPGLPRGSLRGIDIPQPIQIHSRGFLFAPIVSERPIELLGIHAQNQGKSRLRGLDPPGTGDNP